MGYNKTKVKRKSNYLEIMEYKDYYKILGVDKSATDAQIKRV